MRQPQIRGDNINKKKSNINNMNDKIINITHNLLASIQGKGITEAEHQITGWSR